MRVTLSLSEDLVSMKGALLENMANSLAQINASVRLIQLGIKGSTALYNSLDEGLGTLRSDVEAFSEQVLDAATTEAEEFNDSLTSDGDESSLGERALTGWENAANETQKELDEALANADEIIARVDEDGFIVDERWLEEISGMSMTVTTIADQFPMEIALEAAELIG